MSVQPQNPVLGLVIGGPAVQKTFSMQLASTAGRPAKRGGVGAIVYFNRNAPLVQIVSMMHRGPLCGDRWCFFLLGEARPKWVFDTQLSVVHCGCGIGAFASPHVQKD